MPAALPGRRAPSTPRARGNCHHTKRRTLTSWWVVGGSAPVSVEIPAPGVWRRGTKGPYGAPV